MEEVSAEKSPTVRECERRTQLTCWASAANSSMPLPRQLAASSPVSIWPKNKYFREP